MSIPILALAAIGLLVASEATSQTGLLWGAVGVVGAIVVAGIVVAHKSRLIDPFDTDDVPPSADDIERVMAENVAPTVTAKSILGSSPLLEPSPEPLPEPPPIVALEPPPIPDLPLSEPVLTIENADAEVIPVLSPATELFVNLGRRNKQLNRQMLTLISHLQQGGVTAETSDGLSELDHLATRMKRNEDILLMLASVRRVRQWSPAVSLHEVLSSATREVERSARVEIDDVPDIELIGSVVADVGHLIAELIDNATEFSHSSTVVTLSAQSTLEGLEIEVVDSGHGIDEEKLDGLNSLLADPPEVEDAPSRRLGLFIAGHIAHGLDVKVELAGQRGVGTVATVSLPNELLVEQTYAETPSEGELDAIDLVDPVMQVLIGSELAEVDEDELATASLPTEEEFAEALATFPSVEIVDPEPQVFSASSGFPSIADIPETDLSNIPSSDLEPMPLPEVAPVSALNDFDEEGAHDVAQGVASSIAAFSAGVSRGLADAEEELSASDSEED